MPVPSDAGDGSAAVEFTATTETSRSHPMYSKILITRLSSTVMIVDSERAGVNSDETTEQAFFTAITAQSVKLRATSED